MRGRSGLFSLLLIPGLLFSLFSRAQIDSSNILNLPTENFVCINKIIIDGNARTKPQIILREITFSEGDSVPSDELMKKMQESRNHLQNLGLFNEVVVNIKDWSEKNVDVSVSVKERWYTFPIPALDLYDRNFNVWWVDHEHSIKWLQLGLRFYQQNMRAAMKICSYQHCLAIRRFLEHHITFRTLTENKRSGYDLQFLITRQEM
jgi:hypothetical protein